MLSKRDFAIGQIERSIRQAIERSLITVKPSEDLGQAIAKVRQYFAAGNRTLDRFVNLSPTGSFTEALLESLTPPDLDDLFVQAGAERSLQNEAIRCGDYGQAAKHRKLARELESDILARAANRTSFITFAVLQDAMAAIGCIVPTQQPVEPHSSRTEL